MNISAEPELYQEHTLLSSVEEQLAYERASLEKLYVYVLNPGSLIMSVSSMSLKCL